jgi:hypothetical protein
MDSTTTETLPRPHRRRIRLALGILKAIFTTSPFEASVVRVTEDGSILIEPAAGNDAVPSR